MAVATQSKARQQPTAGRCRPAAAPVETAILPRFAISPEMQGHLLAEQILAEFRKDIGTLDLSPKKARHGTQSQGK
jgi:hypothetical protein